MPPRGSIKKVERVGGATHTYAYGYDTAGRLTEVKKNGDVVSTYGYDANGNRLTRTDADGTINGTYDNQDRLTAYGSTTYAYTANGDLRSATSGGATTTYGYDELGNLLAASLPDGRSVAYVVDGANRRIGKKVDGALVQGFLYDGPNVIAELGGSNAVVSRFAYGTRRNVPDYMVRGATTYRIVSDERGSPRLVVDVGTGAVAQRMDFDEFGNVTLDTNPGFQPFGFADGLYDRDTKLTRFGARDYDARTGRWTAKDPIGFLRGDTNLYGYVLNDPVNLIDPSGLAWWHLTGRAQVWADRFSEAVAGFGDVLSPGGSAAVRDLIEEMYWHETGLVDECSPWYQGGELAGALWGAVIGGKGGAKPVRVPRGPRPPGVVPVDPQNLATGHPRIPNKVMDFGERPGTMSSSEIIRLVELAIR